MSSGETCLTMKKVNLVQDQSNCVQICKPLAIGDIQSAAKSKKIAEQIQPMDENENLLRSIINENQQLQNKMEKTIKDVVKVNKKIEEVNVKNVHRNIYEENCKLKQVQVLSENIQLTRRVLTEDQLQALKTEHCTSYR